MRRKKGEEVQDVGELEEGGGSVEVGGKGRRRRKCSKREKREVSQGGLSVVQWEEGKKGEEV